MIRDDLKDILEAEVNKVLEYVKSQSNTYGEALKLADKLYTTANDKIKMFIAEEVRERLHNEMLTAPIKKEAAEVTTAHPFGDSLHGIMTSDGKPVENSYCSKAFLSQSHASLGN